MEVVIEVIDAGRHPFDMPAHAPLESLNLLQRCARHDDVANVALRKMNKNAVDMIELERTADASLAPIRAEHEMLDDQLTASAEQIGEGFLPVGPVEDVSLLHLYPGQCAPLRAQPVAQAGELLFLAQEFGTGRQPLFLRDDRMLLHVSDSALRSGSRQVFGEALQGA